MLVVVNVVVVVVIVVVVAMIAGIWVGQSGNIGCCVHARQAI